MTLLINVINTEIIISYELIYLSLILRNHFNKEYTKEQ
jgi:hypothetical protein